MRPQQQHHSAPLARREHLAVCCWSLSLLLGALPSFGTKVGTAATSFEKARHERVDLVPPAANPAPALLGADGEPLPFNDLAQVEEFLRHAPVVETKLLGKGSTGVLKVTLEDGVARAHAVFRSVDETFGRRNQGTRPDRFARRDSHLFEVAAYRIDRLLALGRVPPTVRRSINGREGSLQLWIENAKTAAELQREGAPTFQLTYHQRQIMRAFDVVVGNWDRHLNNELYDADGRLWFIDHTRSFLLDPNVAGFGGLTSTDERFLQALRGLDRENLRGALRGVVGRLEVDAVLRRAEALHTHFEDLIAARGSESVVYDLSQVARMALRNRDRLAASADAERISISWPTRGVQVFL